VRKNKKAVPPGNSRLQGFNLFVFKFNNGATPRANEMIVVLPCYFITCVPTHKVAGVHQTTLRKQTHGPIDGCDGYARIQLAYFGAQLFYGNVALFLKKEGRNQISLARALESTRQQMRIQLLHLRSYFY